MDNPADKRGMLDNEVFTYKITKDKKVFISWRGKSVVILSGRKAADFISNITNSDGKEAQLIMSKATGNFKHGNEKTNRKGEPGLSARR